MSAKSEIIKKFRKNTLLGDLINNVKFCNRIHQISRLHAIQAGYNSGIAMDTNIADHMAEMSSNTRRRWLCQ